MPMRQCIGMHHRQTLPVLQAEITLLCAKHPGAERERDQDADSQTQHGGSLQVFGKVHVSYRPGLIAATNQRPLRNALMLSCIASDASLSAASGVALPLTTLFIAVVAGDHIMVISARLGIGSAPVSYTH